MDTQNRRGEDQRIGQLSVDMAENERRRASDPRIDSLVADVAVLKDQMLENTVVTTQVRDILASFRIMAAVAKWVAAIGAGIAALVHGIDWLRHK